VRARYRTDRSVVASAAPAGEIPAGPVSRHTGEVTVKRRFWRRRRDLEKQRAVRIQSQENTAQYISMIDDLSDTELMEMLPHAPGVSDPHIEMEMQRRLKGAIFSLIREIVEFRESSEAADKRLARQTSTLIFFTYVLMVLTIVIVILSYALLRKG